MVFVIIRAQRADANTYPPPSSSTAGVPTAPTGVTEFQKDCWDDTDDVGPFVMERAADGPTEPHTELDTLRSPLTLEDLIAAPLTKDFSTTDTLPQSDVNNDTFSEDMDGMLERKHPHDAGTVQIVVPESLRPRLLAMMRYVILAGHPGEIKMWHGLGRRSYWPYMAANAMVTVQHW